LKIGESTKNGGEWLIYFNIVINMKNVLKFLLIGMLVFACKSKKTESTVKTTTYSFEFGKGGGFTGMTNYYRIASDGKVYQLDIVKKDTTFLKRTLNEKEKSELSKRADELLNSQMEYNEPGNMNKIIQIYVNEMPYRTYTWSVGDNQVDSNLVQLHNYLIQFIDN
jgi:hypothetical protein